MPPLNVSFGPVDQLNPDAGFSLTIITTDGRTLFHGCSNPITNEILYSVDDCIEVVHRYSRPRRTPRNRSPRSAS